MYKKDGSYYMLSDIFTSEKNLYYVDYMKGASAIDTVRVLTYSPI